MIPSLLKVLLVEDDWAVRHAVLEYLAENEMELAEADSLEACLQVIEQFTPDVAVLDIVVPEKSRQRADFKQHVGIEIARRLRQRFPQLGIVFLSAFIDRGPEVVQMFMDGHDRISYLLKGSAPEDLLHAIRRMGSGSTGMDIAPGVPSHRTTPFDLALEMLRPAEREVLRHALSCIPELSDSKRKVFDAIGSCLTHQEAAKELNLSPKTISSHIDSIYDELGLRANAATLSYHSLLPKLHLLYRLQLSQAKD